MSAGDATIVDLVARVRERARRRRLEGEIARIERKLEKYGPRPIGLRRQRYFFYLKKQQRLQAELAQPELML